MKQILFRQTLILNRWTGLWLAIAIYLSVFTFEAAAQDPTATPEVTPTLGVPVAPTPIYSPEDRFIDFRVDDDDIDAGECVEFSWVVRGDIDRVEFDQRDDDKEAILVADLDDREECPIKDTDYELIVRWLDNTKTTSKIEVTVGESSSTDTGSDSSSSSGTNNSGSGTNTTVGVFVQVTPILITNTLFNIRVTPVPGSSEDTAGAAVPAVSSAPGTVPVEPTGVLGTINTLPETGRQSVPAEPEPWSFVGGWIILFGGFIFSLLLLKLQCHAP
jgi:hypothetical protein